MSVPCLAWAQHTANTVISITAGPSHRVGPLQSHLRMASQGPTKPPASEAALLLTGWATGAMGPFAWSSVIPPQAPVLPSGPLA